LTATAIVIVTATCAFFSLWNLPAVQAGEKLYVAEPLTTAGQFTSGIEGPACDRDGNVYAVNFGEQGTIGKVTPAGKAQLFLTLPAGSTGNGIRFNARGEMFIADHTGHNILRVDPQTRKITVYAHNKAMNQPNDIALAPNGVLYASDPSWKNGNGQLWRIGKNGVTQKLGGTFGTTNGIEVSPDGKTLYVNETAQRNIWAFTITATGVKAGVKDKRLVKKFTDFGFDGMRCDIDGNLYITRYGKGTVVKLSPAGQVLQEINVLGANPSNICFGGPDGRTAYVTEVEHRRIVKFRVEKAGRSWAENHPADR